MKEVGYKKLLTWQKADQLVFQTYKATHTFPKEELYGLTSQIRRASLSIATNVVEGYSRNSKGEFRRFISISLGSLVEFRYLLSVAFRLQYMKQDIYNQVEEKADLVGRLLWKLYVSLDK